MTSQQPLSICLALLPRCAAPAPGTSEPCRQPRPGSPATSVHFKSPCAPGQLRLPPQHELTQMLRPRAVLVIPTPAMSLPGVFHGTSLPCPHRTSLGPLTSPFSGSLRTAQAMQSRFWWHWRPQPSVEKHHKATAPLLLQLRDARADTHHPDCPPNWLTTGASWQLVGSPPCTQRGAARHSPAELRWLPGRLGVSKSNCLGQVHRAWGISKQSCIHFVAYFPPYPGEHVCNYQLFYPTTKSELKKKKKFDIPKGKDIFQASNKGAHVGLPKINTKMHQG